MSFLKRNRVLIVMVPSIVALHFAWGALQNNPKFVSPEEKKEQPLFIIARKSWNLLINKSDGS